MTDPGLYVLAALACFTLGAVLFLAAGALALTTAARGWRDRRTYRASRVRLERDSRPITTAQDTTVAALLRPCCDRWWTSTGTDHDPDHCTRKGQTT
ncbi:hypothetical protein ACIP6Q_39180 [Streptomyces bobili]|uniref:hypothetical protein n=1 Tax=Streptomyces bobili TaxID=67280 RepID=UPI00380A502B